MNKLSHNLIVPAAFVLGVGLAATSLRGYAGQQTAKPPVQPPAQALELQNAFEQVADHLNPSIVFIRSRQAAKAIKAGGDEEDTPFNFQLPGAPNGRGFRMAPPSNRPSYASGSGVIVRGDGYILTNDHVVQGADKVTVELADGREFTGQVKRDFKSDLALIKIDATGLAAAELADSDKIKVGQWAIAFGAPFGQELRNSMTVGIVSALKRNQDIGAGDEGRHYSGLIQTDASINPGNSGGPLVDVYGRVIGINVAIESPSGGNVGIGFTIPANTARFVMEQLITKGSVTRGYLGLAPKALTFDDQEHYGVKSGALVQQVQAGTPAAKAGFQVEDVILKFNGKDVVGEPELRDMISRTAPGTAIPVVIRRGEETQTLTVTLGTPPETKEAAEKPETPKETPTRNKLGIKVGNLTDPDIANDLKGNSDVKAGAYVVEVAVGSVASDAGFKEGDIITRVNGKNIATAEQLQEAVRNLKAGSTNSFVVHRGDKTLLAQVEID